MHICKKHHKDFSTFSITIIDKIKDLKARKEKELDYIKLLKTKVSFGIRCRNDQCGTCPQLTNRSHYYSYQTKQYFTLFTRLLYFAFQYEKLWRTRSIFCFKFSIVISASISFFFKSGLLIYTSWQVPFFLFLSCFSLCKTFFLVFL